MKKYSIQVVCYPNLPIPGQSHFWGRQEWIDGFDNLTELERDNLLKQLRKLFPASLGFKISYCRYCG